ncbi:Calcium binding protein [Perkinsus chesapeaki]|uniref:Calcium binding protein n=1 Tax=Perkinsus chesapeaki TaxID=330153 RepID=A0A7J6N083_PERCH|nr:Calcium binding protein [Perkinsus chesapeaki]
MTNLSDTDLAEFREVFRLLDTDGSGSISANELKGLLDSIGMSLSMDELEELVTEIDKDCSGAIEFDEFTSVLSRDVNPPFSAAEVEESFRMIARHAPPGHIRLKDLDEALRVHLRDVDHHEINDIIRAYMDSTVGHPSNPDGEYINYQSFIDLMMRELVVTKKKKRSTKKKT